MEINIKNLESLGFKTTGDCTRKKISYYLELCYMHFDYTIRIQTIDSGFSEVLNFKLLEQVELFCISFKHFSIINQEQNGS